MLICSKEIASLPSKFQFYRLRKLTCQLDSCIINSFSVNIGWTFLIENWSLPLNLKIATKRQGNISNGFAAVLFPFSFPSGLETRSAIRCLYSKPNLFDFQHPILWQTRIPKYWAEMYITDFLRKQEWWRNCFYIVMLLSALSIVRSVRQQPCCFVQMIHLLKNKKCFFALMQKIFFINGMIE